MRRLAALAESMYGARGGDVEEEDGLPVSTGGICRSGGDIQPAVDMAQILGVYRDGSHER